MLTNIMVLRTVKENANKAVLDALPSILSDCAVKPLVLAMGI